MSAGPEQQLRPVRRAERKQDLLGARSGHLPDELGHLRARRQRQPVWHHRRHHGYHALHVLHHHGWSVLLQWWLRLYRLHERPTVRDQPRERRRLRRVCGLPQSPSHRLRAALSQPGLGDARRGLPEPAGGENREMLLCGGSRWRMWWRWQRTRGTPSRHSLPPLVGGARAA